MKTKLLTILLTLTTLLFAQSAEAQSYPRKPIRMIIGFPPGTIMDAVARPVTEEMARKLGQPIILEFKPGAGSTLAAKYVTAAEPDGYTLFFSASSAISPLLNPDSGVDSGKELTSIAPIAFAPFFIVSRATLPAPTRKDLIAYSKADPGRLTHGVGTQSAELVMQMFMARSGVRSRSIPYKSAANAVQAMLADEIDLGVGTVASYLPHIQAGKIRALAVMAAQRSPQLPNVPTAAELGIQNLEMASNLGIWAPLNTPKEVVQRISAEARAALAIPEIALRIRKGAAAEPVLDATPENQLRIYEQESRTWAEAARLGNFKAN